MVLISGEDAVVRPKHQQQFYDNLSSPIKEVHTLEGFFHDTLGELDREKAFVLIRKFINKIENNQNTLNLTEADEKGYTYNEYQELLKPKASSFFNELNFAITRFSLKYLGKNLSKGMKIGAETGFDSGSSLDYVYLNKAQGLGIFDTIGLGKMVDRGYLDSIGWRGIRIRKKNLEKLIRKYVEKVKQNGQNVNIMDIAGGHGRYVLDAIEPIRKDITSILIRDYSDINIKAGNSEVLKRKMQDFASFKAADAFDKKSLADEKAKTVVISSGVYELFSDNSKIEASLAGIFEVLEKNGYFIYTNQPWHPQVELIARTLNNHSGEDRWIMRRRTQAEMDALVEQAGFEKIEQLQDDWGIFTVSIAVKR